MNAVQIGPFYVNWSLLSFLVSAAAGYMVILFMLRRSEWKPSPLPDLLVNALMLGIAGWKLSPFFIEPTLAWRAPLKGLLMQGGDMEAVFGLALALVYLAYRTFRFGLPLRVVGDALAYGGVVFIAVRAIVGGWIYGAATSLPWGITLNDPALAYHPVNAYELLLAVVILIYFRLSKISLGDGRAAQTVLIYGGAGLLAISLTTVADTASFVLAGRQWAAILIAVVGLLWTRLCILWEASQERRDNKMTSHDSKAQQEHERETKQAEQKEPGVEVTREFDKKLDGPNQPAE